MRRPRFYGWHLVGIGWVLYGFGAAPAFYTWGFFLPEVIEDLGITRTQAGQIFGLYSLCGGAAAPFVGMALGKWGPRTVIAAGSFFGAVGFYLTATADSMTEFIIFFSVLSGFGHAFATVLPNQALMANWFLKYRARAIAIVFTAGGLVGRVWLQFDAWILERYTWRTGWILVAALSFVLGLLSLALVRNRPENHGQLRDGAQSEEELKAAARALGSGYSRKWTAAQALRTPQFYLMVLCGLGYAVPWGVLNTHGRLHLQDLGFSVSTAAAILGTMALVSIFGRLSGALGDFITPTQALGLGLFIEACGCGLLLVAETQLLAYVAVVCVGIGFGMAYISIAACFSSFFGREAFATTTGTRFFIGAIFTAVAPGATGWVFESTGSYNPAWAALAVLGILGTVVAFTIRPPREPAVETT